MDTDMVDYYDCTLFMTTYKHMCMTTDYTVDIVKIIKFYKQLQHTIDSLQRYFGNMATQIHVHWKESHKDMCRIFTALNNVKKPILIESLQHDDAREE